MLVAHFIHAFYQDKPLPSLPAETALGALLNAITEPKENFQPTNVNWGLLPPLLGVPKQDKKKINMYFEPRAVLKIGKSGLYNFFFLDFNVQRIDFRKPFMETRFQALGYYLKQHRVRKGCSQKYVAVKIGNKTSQFVSNFERGLCSPPLEALQVLIGIYELPEKELLEILVTEQEKYFREKLFGPRPSGKKNQ